MVQADQVDQPRAELTRVDTTNGRSSLEELVGWLHGHDQDLNRLLVERADEYGSGDLEIMAAAMNRLLPENGLDPEARWVVAREMAIAFYLMGKVGRMFSAYERGQVPGTDSWRDVEGYAKIALKLRETGTWTS